MIEKRLPIIEVQPSMISIIGVAINILFLYFIFSFPVNLALLLLALIFDFLDGAFARLLKKSSREGYLLDVFFDRLTEIIIFLVIVDTNAGLIFYILFIINVLLNFYSIKTNNHLSIPLRFVFFIYLIIIGI